MYIHCSESSQESCRKLNTGPISEIIVCRPLLQVHGNTLQRGSKVKNTELILLLILQWEQFFFYP